MSDEFGFGQRAEISILGKYFTFEIIRSLFWSVVLVSHTLFLCFSLSLPFPLSLSFSRTQTLTWSDSVHFTWDGASLPWNRVVSGWLWTIFLSGLSWVTGWVTTYLSPCNVAYCRWSYFYLIILDSQLLIPRVKNVSSKWSVKGNSVCDIHMRLLMNTFY